MLYILYAAVFGLIIFVLYLIEGTNLSYNAFGSTPSCTANGTLYHVEGPALRRPISATHLRLQSKR